MPILPLDERENTISRFGVGATRSASIWGSITNQPKNRQPKPKANKHVDQSTNNAESPDNECPHREPCPLRHFVILAILGTLSLVCACVIVWGMILSFKG